MFFVPIIIQKIAQVTLRRALGLAEHFNLPFNILEYSEHPMAKSYIKLVKSVEPFENYFTEPSLLGQLLLRIQYLIFMTLLLDADCSI